MTKISELQAKLDLIPEEAELVGITCRPHPMGPCPATRRRRMAYCLYFTINGVDSKIEGEYLSNQKVAPKDQPLTHKPFQALASKDFISQVSEQSLEYPEPGMVP